MALDTNLSGVARQFRAQAQRITKRMRTIVAEAHVSACNKAAVSVRAQAVRAVRARYPGFKAATVRETMQIIRATYTKPTATIRVRGRRTPLISLSARQTKSGVSVTVRMRKTIRGAFIATMSSGHRGVFWRTGKFGRRGNPRLEKIEQLYTLSIPQALEQDQILAELRPFAEQRYQIELAREIKFRTERASA